MRLSFDDGTLLLEDAPETVPYAEWDDRVDEYRARAQHYRAIRTLRVPLRGIAHLLDTDDLSISIARRYDLEDAAEAQRAVIEESFLGKLVIIVKPLRSMPKNPPKNKILFDRLGIGERSTPAIMTKETAPATNELSCIAFSGLSATPRAFLSAPTIVYY